MLTELSLSRRTEVFGPSCTGIIVSFLRLAAARNSRDARVRVQGTVAIANCQAFLTIASDFYFASGLGEAALTRRCAQWPQLLRWQAEKGLPQPAPSLLSLPEGEKE